MLFRAMRSIKRGLQRAFVGIWIAFAPIRRILVRLFILPLYRIEIMAKFRIQRLALPVRSLILFFITNKFLFHAMIGIVAVVTIGANLQGRQAHAQNVGQHSILYTLATDQNTEIIKEVVRPGAETRHTNYLGNGTLIPVPHVDFDYTETASNVTPNIVIPGTIAIQPIAETSGGPIMPRTRTEAYTVQKNDTIGGIAQKFGINVGTLLWNNNLTEKQFIRPGDTLKIPPVSGILATIKKGDTITKLASIYNADVADIISFNHLMEGQPLSIGAEIMIPDGRPPRVIHTPHTRVTTYAPPANLAKTSYAPRKIRRPAAAKTAHLPRNKLLWPTSGHIITQYYSWHHSGIDIDGDYTSPIYAAADGVVEKAGWNNEGYGLMILLDHPQLHMKTRYGHSSKIFVKVGDHVTRGEVIAMVGTTGHSSGTHLHFEVYDHGVRTNPLPYIR